MRPLQLSLTYGSGTDLYSVQRASVLHPTGMLPMLQLQERKKGQSPCRSPGHRTADIVPYAQPKVRLHLAASAPKCADEMNEAMQ